MLGGQELGPGVWRYLVRAVLWIYLRWAGYLEQPGRAAGGLTPSTRSPGTDQSDLGDTMSNDGVHTSDHLALRPDRIRSPLVVRRRPRRRHLDGLRAVDSRAGWFHDRRADGFWADNTGLKKAKPCRVCPRRLCISNCITKFHSEQCSPGRLPVSYRYGM